MKIELKSIDYSKSLSEAAHAFTAKIFINDVHAGDTTNRGRDAINSIRHKDIRGRQLLEEAERYCGKLAGKTEEEIKEGIGMYFNLSFYVDDLVDKFLQQKEDVRFKNKMDKAAMTGIVYGNPDTVVNIIRYKITISELLSDPKGPSVLKDKIAKEVMPELKEGDKVYNTNIPESILKNAGLREDQYVKPLGQNVIEQKQKSVKRPRHKL